MIYERIKKYIPYSFFTWILDQFFPHTCRICSQEGAPLCTPCLEKFEEPKPYHHPWILSGLNYHDPQGERIIRRIKNHPDIPMVRAIISYIMDHHWKKRYPQESLLQLWESLLLDTDEKPLVIPIPLHTSRLRHRGYNQSEIIARVFAQLWELPLSLDILIKDRPTAKQGIAPSREARLHNVQDSFRAAYPHLVQGRIIILVDDVCTTGATLDTARSCLLAAGARDVVAFTLAN